ncbi:MAG: cytochrome b/b6 domain-containing protein [Alphaproteobacteria bacterium]|nr:cytochrome b/b6 domain-containing protein [Alphaproteobacteria bacterium]
MSDPRHYSRTQIGLHWLVVVMIVFEYVLSDRIVALWDARMSGAIANQAVSDLHVVVGIMILMVALWRLVLVWRNGLPPLPKATSTNLRRFVRVMDALFYVTLFAMPASGAVAWFFGSVPAIRVHHLCEFLLVALVVVHIAGALVQQFWIRNGVPRRMLGLN